MTHPIRYRGNNAAVYEAALLKLFRKLDLPRLRGHPEKHESAEGVDDGERRRGQAANVFG
jgi:hypothetical protein